MKEKQNTNAVRSLAARDQAIAFIRDNSQVVLNYAEGHPDPFVRALANFTLAEFDTVREVNLVDRSREQDDD